MCEAAPGLRCSYDTQKKVDTLTTRVGEVDDQLSAARKELKVASVSNDFTAYQKAKKVTLKLQARRNGLTTKLRHAQRDLDGTKTGRKKLEAEMAAASSEAEVAELRNRLRASEALRLCRTTALDIKQTEGYVPALRFAERVAA